MLNGYILSLYSWPSVVQHFITFRWIFNPKNPNRHCIAIQFLHCVIWSLQYQNLKYFRPIGYNYLMFRPWSDITDAIAWNECFPTICLFFLRFVLKLYPSPEKRMSTMCICGLASIRDSMCHKLLSAQTNSDSN